MTVVTVVALVAVVVAVVTVMALVALVAMSLHCPMSTGAGPGRSWQEGPELSSSASPVSSRTCTAKCC